MTTLAADVSRDYEVNEDPIFNDLPVIVTDIIYEGAAVGDDASGAARPHVQGDPFWGFADKNADNSDGAVGDINVRVRQQGTVKLVVTGVSGVGDVGEAVYASDDNAFTLVTTSNTQIGKVARWISSTTCMVRFQSLLVQSI